MPEQSQTLFACDHPDCDEKQLYEEFNAALPEGWVSVYIVQGGSPQRSVVIDKVYCCKNHAMPKIIVATQELEDGP